MSAKAAGRLLVNAMAHTAAPISTPAGRARCAFSSVTNFAASAAPATMPTATAALRKAGMRLLVIPSATGTHATSRNRIVEPAPQKRLVPSIEKRVGQPHQRAHGPHEVAQDGRERNPLQAMGWRQTRDEEIRRGSGAVARRHHQQR